MRKTRTSRTALVGALGLAVLWFGCERRDDEGPAEHVGKKVDSAIGKLGEAMEDAGEDLQRESRGD